VVHIQGAVTRFRGPIIIYHLPWYSLLISGKAAASVAGAATATPLSSHVRYAIKEVVEWKNTNTTIPNFIPRFLKGLSIEFDFEVAQGELTLLHEVVEMTSSLASLNTRVRMTLDTLLARRIVGSSEDRYCKFVGKV